MKFRGPVLGVFLAVLAVLCPVPVMHGCDDDGGGGGSDAGVITDVGIIADQNFRPKPNGFAFENYGNDISGTAAANLSAAELSRMFGSDKVCASGSGDTCVLSSTADAWMQARNSEMEGGHCEGMAVLSMFIFSGQGGLKATDFGGASEKDTFSITLPSNTKLQREIAYWFTTQYTNPTKESEVRYAPNDFLAKLIQELQKPSPPAETWDIGFYRVNNGKTEGHAVSPAYVNSQGGGKVFVVVYDNNYPDQEQTIEFDQNANTFKYETATNPKEPKSVWSGDAKNLNISLTPGSPRLKTQDWPPPTSQVKAGLRRGQISMKGPGDLMIGDGKGGRVGTSGGVIINEMPGAGVLVPRGGRPVFEVPEGTKVSITIDGSPLEKQEITGVVYIVPGAYFASVDGINLQPGRMDVVTLSAGGTELSYETSSSQEPVLKMGYETVGHAPDRDFVMHASCDSNARWKVSMKLDREANEVRAEFGSAVAAAMNVSLDSGRIDGTGKSVLEHPSRIVTSGDAARFDYGDR